MKLFAKIAILGATAVLGSNAIAAETHGTAFLDAQTKASTKLDECKGEASLYRLNGELILKLNAVDNCSVIEDQDGRELGKLVQVSGKGYGEISLGKERPGKNVFRVTLSSNSGKTSEKITIVSTIEERALNLSFDGQAKRLPSCGGTVELNMANGAANLIFRGVEDCSNFDIVSNDGASLDYDNKKLQEQGNGTRGGSFTIPRRFIDRGLQTIRIVVKSNSGAHSDNINVNLIGIRW